MSVSTKEITEASRFLRNAAPQQYEKFVAAFANYSAQTTDLMVQATGDLPVMQGHAQQCKKLLRILEEIRHG
jgi:hypothetical protein